jgi:hypothetical protein
MPVDLDRCCTLRAKSVNPSKQLLWDAPSFHPLKKSFLADSNIGPFDVKTDQACYLSTSPGGVDLFLEEQDRQWRIVLAFSFMDIFAFLVTTLLVSAGYDAPTYLPRASNLHGQQGSYIVSKYWSKKRKDRVAVTAG